MKMEVVGIKKNEYVSKKTGEVVKSDTLYCTYRKNGIDGIGVCEIFLNESRKNLYGIEPVIGTVINVERNERGYIDDIEIVD